MEGLHVGWTHSKLPSWPQSLPFCCLELHHVHLIPSRVPWRHPLRIHSSLISHTQSINECTGLAQQLPSTRMAAWLSSFMVAVMASLDLPINSSTSSIPTSSAL